MLEQPDDLTDRVAIITGGGTGIGEATAHVLAHYGAHTVIASRKMENLQRVAAAVEQEHQRRCIPVEMDVRREDQVNAMVDRTVQEFGRIDILVNNAGGTYLFPLEKIGVESWDNTINLNLRGPYLTTHAVGPHMIAQKRGAIVNISSGAGVHGGPGGAHYSAAKAGLQMFTRVVAMEWGEHNIRANAIAVGAVASEGALRAWARFGMTPESAGRRTPLRRVGQPDDIAYAIHFFVSDASSWISGETLSVNGGPPSSGGISDD